MSEWCYLNGGVPQGTKLAILLFLVMINDLKPICPTIKFVDDVTSSESKPLIGPSQMGGALVNVSDFSLDNDMNANPTKTKRMLINFSEDKNAYHDLYFNEALVQICTKAKLLGVIIQDDLKWDSHVSMIVSKASQRLHYLRILRRSGYSDKDLIQIYISRIRSILDYACQVWHPGLTQYLAHDLERVQIRAMGIIRPDLTYWQALETYNLQDLDERRTKLCNITYNSIKQPDNIIHNLLPDVRPNTYNIRSHKQRLPIKSRVKRTDSSFINYAVKKFE